jgi:hypothetical protein
MNYESDKYRIATYDVPAQQSFIHVDRTQLYIIQQYVGDIATFVPPALNYGYIYAVWESIVIPGNRNINTVFGFSISQFDIYGNPINWPNTIDNLRIWDASKLTWINMGQCIAIAAPPNFKNYYLATAGITVGPYIQTTADFVNNFTYSFPYGTPGVNTIPVVLTNNNSFVRNKGYVTRNSKISWDFGEDYVIEEAGNYAIAINLFIVLNGVNVNGNTGIGDCQLYVNEERVLIQYWCLENVVTRGTEKLVQINFNLLKKLNLSDIIYVQFNCETGSIGPGPTTGKPTCFGMFENPADVFARFGILPQANTFQIVQIND